MEEIDMNKFILSSLLFSCLTLIVNSTFAEEAQPPQNEKEKVILASTLAAYGESQKDALALANAANIYLNLSAGVLKAGEEGMEGAKVDPIELLANARQIAEENNNQELVTVIDKIEQTQTEGAKSKHHRTRCYWREMWIGWYYEYVWWCR